MLARGFPAMLRKLSPMTVGDVAFSGDEPKLRRLLLAGANPNDPAQRRDDGSGTEPKQRDTPLMDAVWRGHGPVVETLIASRADLAATNADGLTALHLAAQWGHVGLSASHSSSCGPELGFTNALAPARHLYS